MTDAEQALELLRCDVLDSCTLDKYIGNKRPRSRSERVKNNYDVSEEMVCKTLQRTVGRLLQRCRRAQASLDSANTARQRDVVQHTQTHLQRFGRRLDLGPYLDMQMLYIVPKTVNVVTVSALL